MKNLKQSECPPLEVLWAKVIYEGTNGKPEDKAIEFIAQMLRVFKQYKTSPKPICKER